MHVTVQKVNENKYIVTLGDTVLTMTRSELAEFRVQLNRLNIF
jgi:hypothetical protein